MTKAKRDESLIMLVLIIIAAIFFIWNNYYQTNKCKKNNGIVATDNLGLFDKCLYNTANETMTTIEDK